jgi:hypothetical protein
MARTGDSDGSGSAEVRVEGAEVIYGVGGSAPYRSLMVMVLLSVSMVWASWSAARAGHVVIGGSAAHWAACARDRREPRHRQHESGRLRLVHGP